MVTWWEVALELEFAGLLSRNDVRVVCRGGVCGWVWGMVFCEGGLGADGFR